MGEVYRARDLTLGRDVAIKILPAAFAADPVRLARFEREARVLASINHPHIGAIYGIEEADGLRALVLELVEGQTLADRLQRGSIPIAETLTIARQIADALEAAHNSGIIHRDLKPANIAITPTGTVKVLDFGLAKAVGGTSLNVSQPPTVIIDGTQEGLALGTAPYMSPEQARGAAVDKRTDIWAFGCVLYEMLTGKRAFGGDDVQETFVAILRDEPEWARLPPTLSPALGIFIRRCLHKDPRQRIHDIADMRLALEGAFDVVPATREPMSYQPRWWRAVIAGAFFVAGIGVAVATSWAIAKVTPAPKMEPIRLAIVPSTTQPLAVGMVDRILDVSPDGTHVVYVGPQGQLMVRAIDQLEAEPLRGITGARAPFYSPNGKWIGFFQGDTELKKVSASGGPAITLCRTGHAPRGASWGSDDTIVFATADLTTGLLSVSAGGGEPTGPDDA